MPTNFFRKGNKIGMGRPKGAKNYNPSKKRLTEAFERAGFNYPEKWLELFKSVDDQNKVKMMIALTEFLFPKRRAEDDDGQTEQASIVAVSPELLVELRSLKESIGERENG